MEFATHFETEANKYLIKNLKYMMVIIAVFWALNFFGVFIIPKTIMALAAAGSCILLMIPVIICRFIGYEKEYIKYIILLFMCLAVCVLSVFITYHAAYAFMLPLLFAAQYREKKLLYVSYILTLVFLVISTYLGYFIGLCDLNILFLNDETMKYYIDNSTNETINLHINTNPYTTIGLYFILPKAILLFYFTTIVRIIIKKNSQYSEHSFGIRMLNETDSVTRFYNKEKFEQMVAGYYQKFEKIGIIFWDINNLKKVNDTYGHIQGDFIITTTADFIFAYSNERSRAYRVGGDEFVLVVENPEKGECEKIIDNVNEKLNMFNETSEIVISVAAGCTYGYGKNIYNLLEKADACMYEDKEKYKQKEQLLDEASANLLDDKFFNVYSNAFDQVYFFIADMDAHVTRYSKNAVDFFALPGEYIENADELWAGRVHPNDRIGFISDLKDVFENNKRNHQYEYRILNKYNQYTWVECHGTVFFDSIRNKKVFTGFLVPLDSSSKYDPLTKLKSISEIDSIDFSKNNGAAILLDIDDFRKTVIILGYEYGNRVLCAFANALMQYCGSGYKCYRIEGDEFLLIAENVTRDNVKSIWEDISNATKNITDDTGRTISIKLTAGVVMFPEHAKSKAEVMDYLKHTIEYAKSHNKGFLTFFTEDIIVQHKRTLGMRQDILFSIKNNRIDFEMNYQPIIAASDEKTIMSCEALFRHKKWKESYINVGEAIKILEQSGEIDTLGRWIINEVFLQARIWQKKYEDLSIGVNISILQFRDVSLVDYIIETAQAYKINPNKINLELTESFDIEDYEQTKSMINALRNYGFNISLDDFGLEYSTLMVIKELPADYIKIDQFFVKSLVSASAGSSEAIIEAIMGLAKRMNLKVIAEGVETAEVLEKLRKFKVLMYQGYYFSRPLSVMDFEKALESSNI